MLSTELRTAYENTDFYIFAPEVFFIRPNQTCLAADALLQAYDCSTGTVLTAYNPMSIATAVAENHAAQLELKNVIENLGYSYLIAEGRGRDSDWPPEPSLFIMGVPFHIANQLACDFRQAAFTEIALLKTCRIVETNFLSTEESPKNL